MNYYISDMNSQNRINSIVFRPDTWVIIVLELRFKLLMWIHKE